MIWMIGTLTSFCLMAVGIRELAGQIDTFQMLFFRSAIGLVIVFSVIVLTGNYSLFLTHRKGLHSLRNIFHFMGQYGWFLGITLLPLAEVFALEFTVPFWTALIAFFFLKEKLTARRITSIMLGMVGVLIILKPGIEIVSYASLIVLAAAMCYAVAHTSTKALSSTENPLTILFFMCFLQLPIGLYFSLQRWQTPEGLQWFWLAIIGFTALSAHFCMTKAMQYSDVTMVVTMDFLRLPLISVVGVLIYSESFQVALLVGAIFMLLGNLLNMHKSKKLTGSE